MCLHRGITYSGNDAIIYAAAVLGGVWTLARVILLVPSPLRRLAYTAFAALRYRLFGTSDKCRRLTPTLRPHFLEFSPFAPTVLAALGVVANSEPAIGVATSAPITASASAAAAAAPALGDLGSGGGSSALTDASEGVPAATPDDDRGDDDTATLLLRRAAAGQASASTPS